MWSQTCSSLPLSRPRGQLSAELCPTSASCSCPSPAGALGYGGTAQPRSCQPPRWQEPVANLSRTFCTARGPLHGTVLEEIKDFSLVLSEEDSSNLAARRSQQKKLRLLKILSVWYEGESAVNLAGSKY